MGAIEDMDIIKFINSLAERLPPEERSNLYRTARDFLNYGVDVGVAIVKHQPEIGSEVTDYLSGKIKK